jgi:hydrogenase nickel incorporation protein HypA/HybF
MHELPVTRDIMRIALEYAETNNAKEIISVTLRVGAIQNFIEDITQKYWNYISRGTIAEGARVKFINVPATFACKNCEEVYSVEIRDVKVISCSKCGSLEAVHLTGKELSIEGIEITTL